MVKPRVSLLYKENIQEIHEHSLKILKEVGVAVHNPKVREIMGEAGCLVDNSSYVVRINEELISWAVKTAGKQYTVYGRDKTKKARFGYGDHVLMQSPGQYGWFEEKTGFRRDPLLADSCTAAKVGDALNNISIVGAMSIPVDVPVPFRDVVMTAELAKITAKPFRVWPVSVKSTKFVFEILKTIAGGKDELKKHPMTELFIEPISPLQLARDDFDILSEYIDHGQPVAVGPMAMTTGTAPGTLAGTMAQENAELLSGIVAVQLIAPGTPIMYSGIPHIMDPRTSICSFGSPEQGLMAVGMTEIGRSYGFPVYVNVNLTDSKVLDVQAGMEKMGKYLMGMMAGAELFGHAGHIGTDHGGSLSWLVLDDEAASYAKRISRGFEIDEEKLAFEAIKEIGPSGNYLSHKHTVKHFRNEIWIPGPMWVRDTYESWEENGKKSMEDYLLEKVESILKNHQTEPMDHMMVKEIDNIVSAAKKEIGSS